MRVLICMETSGVVRDAFAALGHDAWSCDLLPPDANRSDESKAHHLQEHFRRAHKRSLWEFVGYHPDCRVMANSGVRWLSVKPGRWEELEEAAELFRECIADQTPGYVENSVMHCHAKALIGREQDQTIQPWHHGEPFFKATCLWLRGGLKPLVDTNRLTPPVKGTDEHKAWSMVHRASPGKDRWKIRSRSFPGIAKAMADQFSRQMGS